MSFYNEMHTIPGSGTAPFPEPVYNRISDFKLHSVGESFLVGILDALRNGVIELFDSGFEAALEV